MRPLTSCANVLEIVKVDFVKVEIGFGFHSNVFEQQTPALRTGVLIGGMPQTCAKARELAPAGIEHKAPLLTPV